MTDEKKKRNAAPGLGFGLLAILLAAPVVKHFEGLELKTYKDPVGIPTACYGETDKEVVRLEQFTVDQCTMLLGASMIEHMNAVSRCIEVPVKPHEAAAIISWSYNVGAGAACRSTLVRKLNAGAEPLEWCFELKKWTMAGGKRLPGLVRRRSAEYLMCLTGEWKP